MIACDLKWIASQVDGKLVGANTTVQGVSTDTRSLNQGDLFVALVAERDGHEFIESAQQAGAVAALVSRRMPLNIPQIIVTDTLKALGELSNSSVQETNPLSQPQPSCAQHCRPNECIKPRSPLPPQPPSCAVFPG